MELENINRITLDKRQRRDYKGRYERWRMLSFCFMAVSAILLWFLIGAIHANHEMQVQMMAAEAVK